MTSTGRLADTRPSRIKEPHTPHPHPAAPSEIADQFSSFQKTLESGPHFDANKLKDFKVLAAETAYPVGAVQAQGPVQSGALDPKTAGGEGATSQQHHVAEDLHDLPPRFWKTPTLLLEEVEMEAVMVSCARTARRIVYSHHLTA